MKNASDPRLRAVIEAATERFRWGRAKSRAGQGFGMMAGFDKGGYVSACVEITVVNNVVKIDRVVQAFECGAIVNPDELRNQIVGGTMMGIGGALFEAMDFENGHILNPRLSKYRVPRFNDAPQIEVVMIDRKDLPSAGAGETPIVALAPSVANAIFDATGKRLRSMPLRLSWSYPPAVAGLDGTASTGFAAGSTTISARWNANRCPVSSIRLIWHVYRPVASCASGAWKRTDTVWPRFGMNDSSRTGSDSKVLVFPR